MRVSITEKAGEPWLSILNFGVATDLCVSFSQLSQVTIPKLLSTDKLINAALEYCDLFNERFVSALGLAQSFREDFDGNP